MKSIFAFILALLPLVANAQNVETNPQAVVDLCSRVCGDGAAEHFTFVADKNVDGCARYFTIEPADGKIKVTANDYSSLCFGLNWYLNHTARVNIAWNNLRQTVTDFPLPAAKETHTTFAAWSYYLNYCTFSYSMTTWDEERWMKEIDWMALHGVNLPLQAVGIDAVWYQMLTGEFGFSHKEASEFVAGPAFQGWWLMNNLTGHGGPNPEWWYERQADLGRKITDRMRSLDMSPCLPGFVGMAPQKYVTQTGAKSYGGTWCGFTSPLLIAPGTAFDRMAEQYYIYINKVYGFLPKSYSMDPVHERDLPSGMGQTGYKDLCTAARNAMNTWGCEGETKPLWVAQEWQVNADQYRINSLTDENTLLLDLSSERLTYKSRYGNKEYLFCMLHNYGGNIGMYGCVEMMLKNYKEHLKTGHPDRATSGVTKSTAGFLCGVGATPEGIETNPMLYDLLFDLPWLENVPEAKDWLNEYAICRYGVEDEKAQQAWQNMLKTVYACTNTNQQGCREPVFCARPNLKGDGASSWANASYYWDKQLVADAARLLLDVEAEGKNYDYDIVDFTRQALTDYAHTLQMDMAAVGSAKGYKSDEFKAMTEQFLALMDDVDVLLGTIEEFRLGRWAGAARKVAVDAGHPEDADWMEKNARMLITTWGDSYAATNNGGLRDYGNREWQGLITGCYKPRWEAYFNDLTKKGSCSITAANWLDKYERPFVYGQTVAYGAYEAGQATGNVKELCRTLLDKYCPPKEPSKWAEPSQSSQGLSETQGYHCYVTSFKYENLTTGEPATTIYTANADPASLFMLVVNPIEARPGDEVRITWTGSNDFLNYCYLSAYLDTDSDGSFDSLLHTLGTYQKKDSRVKDGNFTFTVPATLTEDSRLRLRYDGAWNTGWDASTKSFPADNLANRPVYDIPLHVIIEDGIDKVCTTDTSKATSYDLNGRIVKKAAKGVKIINGNKYMLP